MTRLFSEGPLPLWKRPGEREEGREDKKGRKEGREEGLERIDTVRRESERERGVVAAAVVAVGGWNESKGGGGYRSLVNSSMEWADLVIRVKVGSAEENCLSRKRKRDRSLWMDSRVREGDV